MARARSSSDIAEQLGRVAEAVDDAKNDRRQFREDMLRLTDKVEKLDTSVSGLDGSVHGLMQSMDSLGRQVSTVAVEKCGERLDIIERDRKREADELAGRLLKFDALTEQSEANSRTLEMYRKVIGTGASLVVRIGIALLGSTAAGVLIGKFWH